MACYDRWLLPLRKGRPHLVICGRVHVRVLSCESGIAFESTCSCVRDNAWRSCCIRDELSESFRWSALVLQVRSEHGGRGSSWWGEDWSWSREEERRMLARSCIGYQGLRSVSPWVRVRFYLEGQSTTIVCNWDCFAEIKKPKSGWKFVDSNHSTAKY